VCMHAYNIYIYILALGEGGGGGCDVKGYNGGMRGGREWPQRVNPRQPQGAAASSEIG